MMKLHTNGFSLIEVLIAFTILGFITIGMYSITDNNLATKERVLTDDARYLNIKMALDILERDLNHIYSPIYFTLDQKFKSRVSPLASPTDSTARASKNDSLPYSDFFRSKTLENLLIPTIDSEKTSLRFLSSGHIRKIEDIKQSSYEWIEYKLIAGKKNQELVRIVESNDIYSDDPLKDNHQEILMENIKKMEFSFWNPIKKKFLDLRSLPSIQKNKWLAVKVKLTWINVDNNEEKEERIFRPSWPNFDSIVDWKKRLEIEKKNKEIDNNSNSLTGNLNNNDRTTN